VQETEVRRRVGKRIREYRKAQGLSQDILCDISGLNRAHIGELERGECNVTLRTLKTLADSLKVRIADLTRDV